MANITVAFALAGVILILGFVGNYLFKRLSIPDILILIFLGYLIGPVFKIVDYTKLNPILPVFTSLALIIILFDGGLNLNLGKVLSESPRAIILATIGFVLSVIATAFFAKLFFGWSLIAGAVLGTIIGGTSSSIVIPLVNRASVSDQVKTLLSLESAFTDAIVVVVSLALLPLLLTGTSPGFYSITAKSVASAFSIGAVIGIIAGTIWLRILRYIKGETYDDIITLAFVLLMFAGVESLGGNGAIFALIFGLVLGNGHTIAQMLNLKKITVASVIMKKFHSQISFLIRTFFFVYIGFIFSIRNPQLLSYTAILCMVLLGTRFVAAHISTIKSPVLFESRDLIIAMLPRGLAAAVLAQFIINAGIPNAQIFSEIIITVIIITTLVSVVGTSLFQHEVKVETNKKS